MSEIIKKRKRCCRQTNFWVNIKWYEAKVDNLVCVARATRHHVRENDKPATACRSRTPAPVKGESAREEGRAGVVREKIQIDNWEDYLSVAKVGFEERLKKGVKFSCSRDDFTFLKTIGTGAFGKVMLVMHKSKKEFFAAKVMSKQAIVKDKGVEHARNEKELLMAVRFPFTLHMEYFFKDNANLYYIVPLMLGGELFTILQRKSHLTESEARFYVAQVVLALEYLHYMDILYRDLKPENVLLEPNGYAKLGDFGFCKLVRGRTYTVCGTPEYMSPEILTYQGYGKSVDWWALGVFAYELCAGYTPFYSKYTKKIYSKIERCEVNYPPTLSRTLVKLLQKLLVVDLSKRYGLLKRGVKDIKNDRWFSDIDWLLLVNKKIKAPLQPALIDLQNISKKPHLSEKLINKHKKSMYAKEFADF